MTDDRQQRVAAFLDAHELHAPPAYRLLDLAAEVGELAADATKSSEYGARPGDLQVNRDELGDALFCLYALADELDVDAGEALEESIAKYEARIDDAGAPGSDATE
ncbi:MazG nucleotide pyrophosphohydrolase domain-containing protein [Halogeometricum sp. CBA1124]|uniref:MazG nucleotide pyrophosphohydrolase domain-containing protein n=1 Tax=Halogeometricum sp. CBA1124 TaxID=2668071 RepID=UPI00142AC9CA|nr:nucleotide pyrophosphohydrolase [Halogeometricum sp. CBA1124]